MEEKLEIFYVRHADAVDPAIDGRDVCDREVTALGKKQLELLGKRFEGCHFDAVLSSPLVRCVETAAAICNSLDERPVMELVPELIERGSTPGYAGCSLDYLSRYYDKLTVCRDNIFGGEGADFPNKEKSEAMERARAVIAYLKKRFTFGQKILVVSHACFGNSFLPSAVSIREEEFRFTLFNTSVSKVKYTPDGVERISFMNDCSHLLPIMPEFQFEI